MNRTLQNLCLTLGTGLALGGFSGTLQAARPSRLAVTKAVTTQPFTEDEKQERLKELRTQVQNLFEAKEYDKAMLVLTQISELDPSVGPAHTRMAVLLASLGIPQVVRQQLEAAVKTSPEDPEAYIHIARIAVQESRLAEATLLLGRAQQLLEEYKGPEIRKESLETLLSEVLALYSEVQEDWRGLLGIFQYQEKRDPENASLKVQIGLVHLKMKDETTALQKLREAKQLAPTLLPPETLAAEFFLNGKERPKVAEYLPKGLAAEPENLSNLLKGTELYFRMGELDQVRKLVEQAEKVSSTDSEVLRWKGQLALIDSDLETAVELLRQAIQIDGKNINAVMVYIETLLMAEQTDLHKEALNVAKQLIQISSQNPLFLAHLAWALKENGSREEALTLIQQLQQVWKPTPDSQVMMAICLLDPANPVPSLELVKSALASDEYFTFHTVAEQLKEATESRIQALEEEQAKVKQALEEEEKVRKAEEKETELPPPPAE